ncbi:hypothetical protein [Aureliella helgolandensis]|uniref:Uncharacterized protein n=1 Tax=Aureliella helgolandensis TaxID=2527968 RepID=A0A518G748_9BACT|nr:hypothetical protein [Aureliella helgolandensis]QDV24417.1 hypothetical protein Q31a_27340 [Aureliella helgolandensis]
MNTATMNNEAAALDAIEQWNKGNPDATRVIYQFGKTPVRTTTIGGAFAINGRPMLRLAGVAGAVDLADVKAAPYHAWVRIHRRRRMSHWVEGWWDDKEHLESDLEMHAKNDPVFESYEYTNVRPSDA